MVITRYQCHKKFLKIPSMWRSVGMGEIFSRDEDYPVDIPNLAPYPIFGNNHSWWFSKENISLKKIGSFRAG